MSYRTIDEIRAANTKAGFHFFDSGSLRFFASVIGRRVYRGKFFVTSEQFRPLDGPPAARRYTVRMAKPDGSIETIGPFQFWSTRKRAVYAAQHTPDIYSEV